MSDHRTAPTRACAWKNGRYIYCLSHSASQVSGDIEYLEPESGWLSGGRRCDWCKTTLGRNK